MVTGFIFSTFRQILICKVFHRNTGKKFTHAKIQFAPNKGENVEAFRITHSFLH